MHSLTACVKGGTTSGALQRVADGAAGPEASRGGKRPGPDTVSGAKRDTEEGVRPAPAIRLRRNGTLWWGPLATTDRSPIWINRQEILQRTLESARVADRFSAFEPLRRVAHERERLRDGLSSHERVRDDGLDLHRAALAQQALAEVVERDVDEAAVVRLQRVPVAHAELLAAARQRQVASAGGAAEAGDEHAADAVLVRECGLAEQPEPRRRGAAGRERSVRTDREGAVGTDRDEPVVVGRAGVQPRQCSRDRHGRGARAAALRRRLLAVVRGRAELEVVRAGDAVRVDGAVERRAPAVDLGAAGRRGRRRGRRRGGA